MAIAFKILWVEVVILILYISLFEATILWPILYKFFGSNLQNFQCFCIARQECPRLLWLKIAKCLRIVRQKWAISSLMIHPSRFLRVKLSKFWMFHDCASKMGNFIPHGGVSGQRRPGVINQKVIVEKSWRSKENF